MEVTWRGEAMIAALSGRTAQSSQDYLAHQAEQGDACPFCNPAAAFLVETTEFHHVLINRFPYVVWDSQAVTEHLMIVPRAHHVSLSTMNETEHRELFAMLRDYEPGGYSIYTRSSGNQGRSQSHIHTHLIKVGGGFVDSPSSSAPVRLRDSTHHGAPDRLRLAPDTATA